MQKFQCMYRYADIPARMGTEKPDFGLQCRVNTLGMSIKFPNKNVRSLLAFCKADLPEISKKLRHLKSAENYEEMRCECKARYSDMDKHTLCVCSSTVPSTNSLPCRRTFQASALKAPLLQLPLLWQMYH